MIDLRSHYLNLELKNPLIASAFPRNRELAYARQLEEAGVAAIVMPSLFEEELINEQETLSRFLYQQDIGHAESSSFLPQAPEFSSALDCYLEDLCTLKSTLDIPVIASLNGVSNEGWADYAKELQLAGADALEMNIYYIAANGEESGSEVEQRYVDLVSRVKKQLSIPVAVKISSQFSSPAHFALQLEQAGADALVIFNRFYQPDIDINAMQVDTSLELSQPWEALLRVRWTAILSHQLAIPISVTGGIHCYQQVAKAVLAGAHTTQICSAIVKQGPAVLGNMLEELEQWMAEKEFDSLADIRGSLSQPHSSEPAAYERVNYLHLLDSYSRASGVHS